MLHDFNGIPTFILQSFTIEIMDKNLLPTNKSQAKNGELFSGA